MARLPAAVRRRQLLTEAVTVFAAKGFHGTAMTDVAVAAGVTKPVLYQHFASKRDLYLALLQDVGDRLRQAIEKVVAEAAGPRDQVVAGFTAYFRFVDENQAAFHLLFGGGTRRDPEFAEVGVRVEEAIANSVVDLIAVSSLRSDERAVLGHAIVGLAEGACRHWISRGRPGTPEEMAEQVAALAWAGLRGVGST